MTPKQMLDIFRSNIVILRGIPESNGGLDYLKISKKIGASGEVKRGNDSITVDVMQIEKADAGDAGAFLTWICDYKEDDIKYKTLSDQRKFCFTANMNGCTFGIGAAGPKGVVTVSHANAKDVGSRHGLDQQAAHQKTMVVGYQPISSFDPNHYMVGIAHKMGYNTTTFGVYDNNEWSFYYQSYLTDGFRYELKTLRKIDTSRITA